MCLLIENIVLSELTAACLLAASPTIRSFDFVKATTEGVVRYPSLLVMTVGVSPSITATQLLVVPKSIPITVPIINSIQYIDIFILPYKIHLTIKKKIKIRKN